MEFDVFLSHNSKDKPAVRELARRLGDCGLRVWLDEDQLIPGRNWQPLLEQGIEHSATGAVLVGQDGLGPWEDEEQALLRHAVCGGDMQSACHTPSSHRYRRFWCAARLRPLGATRGGAAARIWMHRADDCHVARVLGRFCVPQRILNDVDTPALDFRAMGRFAVM